jgi:hypothetical protein
VRWSSPALHAHHIDAPHARSRALLSQAVCDLALNFGEGDDEGETTMARPFGVALLVAGWDHRGPVLYHTDPSGTFTRFDAKAIGAGSEGAQTALQEQFHKNLTLLEAETMAITILKQVMEEKLDATNVEVRTPRENCARQAAATTATCARGRRGASRRTTTTWPSRRSASAAAAPPARRSPQPQQPAVPAAAGHCHYPCLRSCREPRSRTTPRFGKLSALPLALCRR